VTAPDAPFLSEPPQAAARTWDIPALVGAQLLLGVLAGVVWRLWAPATAGFLVPGPHGSTVFIPAEAEDQIAGDGRFLLVTVVAGVLASLAAWFLLRRRRGPMMVGALVVGSLAGSLLARWVGVMLSSGHAASSDQSVVYPALTLHAQPILLFQAFAAVLLYTALAGFSGDAEFTASPAPIEGDDRVLLTRGS
jgi:hypothetical protein